jgi:DNA repair photolyase
VTRQLQLFERDQPTLRGVAEAVQAQGLDGLPGAVERADHVRYQEVTVRSALTEVRGMPFRWALNPYRGCSHGCEYCYARKYQRHLELGAGDDFSSFVMVKTNMPARLAIEVSRPRWARETVAVGTATDAYQPIEGRYQVTRRCLEVLVASGTPFTIVTKGPMVVRDLDLLKQGAAGAGCQVYMSVPSVDERAWLSLEPGTAPPAQRLAAARRLAAAGVDVSVLMMPLVPGITTARSSIKATVQAIAAHGLRLAGANVARLDPGVREHFFGFLTREYPDLVAGYERLFTTKQAPSAYVSTVKAIVREASTLAGTRRDRGETEGFLQSRVELAEGARADEGAGERRESIDLPFADVDEDRTRAHAGDRPADAEEHAAERVAPVKRFQLEGERRATNRAAAAANPPHDRRRQHDGRADDAVELEALEEEHRLDEVVVGRAGAAEDEAEKRSEEHVDDGHRVRLRETGRGRRTAS